MKYGLSKSQWDEVTGILAEYPEIDEAILFGSRATDTYKEASDVDLAIKGKKATFSLAAKVKSHLEEETYLPFFFDIIAYKSITSEKLKKQIKDHGVTVYEKGKGKREDREIEVEWKEHGLGEIYDFASGLSKGREEFGFGYEFLSFRDVFNNFFVPDKLTQLANTTDQERKRCSIRRGDVFLTRTSETQEDLGMSSVALKDYPNATFNGFTKRLRPRDPSLVLPEYAGFYFRSPYFRATVTSMASITTRASLNNGMLNDLKIVLPSLSEQRSIAGVLSSLDDKIDLLHRQNQTLEALAETLFRQWFVEEAGEEWEESSLLDIIQLIGGGTPKTTIPEYWDGNIPWLAGGDIASNHKSFVIDSSKKITRDGLNNSSAKLLPKYATVISARGTVGKYCLLAQPMAFSQSNYGILPQAEISDCFCFVYLLLSFTVGELQSSAYGSVFDTITTTTFKEVKVPVPSVSEIRQFDDVVMPCFNKILSNTDQIRTLEQLRDTLLPKLMSGEVRVGG